MASRPRYQRLQPQTIELDELLHGNPSWDQVVQFWRFGEFHEEHYSVAAIEKHLLTEEQRRGIFDRRLSIEKMLNARVEGEDNQRFVESVYHAWNVKLGYYMFGHDGSRHGQPYAPDAVMED